jgi:hypothetical protein
LISSSGERAARARRSFKPGDMVLDPLHVLAALQKKHRAVDEATALKDWKLPQAFGELRSELRAHTRRPFLGPRPNAPLRGAAPPSREAYWLFDLLREGREEAGLCPPEPPAPRGSFSARRKGPFSTCRGQLQLKLNRKLYGIRWAKHRKGVRWARAAEFQRRGAIHFHALMAGDGLATERRLFWMDAWHDLGGAAGFARIEVPEGQGAVLGYCSKYVDKHGNIDLSPTMGRPVQHAMFMAPPFRCATHRKRSRLTGQPGGRERFPSLAERAKRMVPLVA